MFDREDTNMTLTAKGTQTTGSRRDFMKIATVGTAGAALGGAATPAIADAHTDARYDAGLELLNSLGADTSLEAISPDLAKLYVQHAYGDVISRDVLDPMTREAVAIASLMNSGNYTQPILEHINAYLNLGGKPEALLEMCFIAIAVMGFPSAINTTGKIRTTLAERGIEIEPVPEATDDGTERYLMGARYMIANTEGGIQELQDLTEENPAFAKILASYAYGEIMTRDGLDARTKTLTTLAMLATQGNAQSWIRDTTLGGLRQNVSRDDIVESMLQLTVHRGYPSAIVALFQVKEVFDGLDAGTLSLDEADGEIPEVTLATREARFAQGELELSKTTGAAGAAVVSSFADMAPDIGNHIMEYLYGDVFSRPEISLRDREISTVSALAATGTLTSQGPMRVHFNASLTAGLTKIEIQEVLLNMVPFVGFPKVQRALEIAQEVFDEREM
ncbi:MAG: 4-carboxymuconolactone decarboxylase [Paracoccaceae bacterium]|jgi:4-carboxymuconolactone decarboxylase